MKKGQLIGIILVILLSISSLVIIPVFISIRNQREEWREYLLGFTEIVILRDEDFTIYNFSGSGSESDPYIIENLLIKDIEVGINIEDTKSCFQIINCSIFASTSCISIRTVAANTATIRNCNLRVNNTKSPEVGFGIDIVHSEGVDIINNTCLGPLKETNWSNPFIAVENSGIYLGDAPNSKIIENNCSNWYSGVSIDSSDYTQISNNNLSKNRSGFSDSNSKHLIISLNICHYNSYGIVMDQTKYATVSYNNLLFNNYGIYFALSLNCNIFKNNIEFNSHYGLGFWFSEFIFIYENNFIGNCYNETLIGHPQATELGDSNQNNYFYDNVNNIGNYWSDLIWDETAIYYIDGSNNTDLYPLENPVSI